MVLDRLTMELQTGCKVDEPKESYGEGTAILTYCRFCDKKGTHITANCPWEPDDESDSDDDPDVVEYGGEREGYSWTCLLGCGSYPCTLDHYYNKGIYVQKACRLCYKVGHHWSYECSIKPTYTYDLPTSTRICCANGQEYRSA